MNDQLLFERIIAINLIQHELILWRIFRVKNIIVCAGYFVSVKYIII